MTNTRITDPEILERRSAEFLKFVVSHVSFFICYVATLRDKMHMPRSCFFFFGGGGSTKYRLSIVVFAFTDFRSLP